MSLVNKDNGLSCVTVGILVVTRIKNLYKLLGDSAMGLFQNTFHKTKIWYHGTTSDCLGSLKSGIRVDYSKRSCDFGVGFYLTSRKEQAKKWAIKKHNMIKKFNKNAKPVVVSFVFNRNFGSDKVTIFEIGKSFFEFIYANRNNKLSKQGVNIHDYKAVFGGVIDGDITNLNKHIRDYKKGKIDDEILTKLLLGEYYEDNQLCICKQELICFIEIKEEEVFCDVN